MGVAVLQPKDCLRNSKSCQGQAIISSPPKMQVSNPNPKPIRSSRNHPNRLKRSQNGCPPTRPASAANPKPQVNYYNNNNKLVMDQVKILKRGEQLAEVAAVAANRKPETVEKEFRESLDLGPTEPPSGPIPELDPIRKVAGLYAGSSMLVASPPPSSVPLPAFFTKKTATATATVSDATSDLRRMLRLDFS